MEPLKHLRLLLYDEPIGVLTQYGDYLRVSFDSTYIEDSQRPTLSLSYRGVTESDTQAILRSTVDARVIQGNGRWPVYFQNLLPEGHNRDRLASQRGCLADDEFELLAAAGGDLMGAVSVRPLLPSEQLPSTLTQWQESQGLADANEALVEQPVEDAMALAGVVTKFSAVNDGRRYIVKRDGEAGSFILKLPTSRHPDLVEVEFYGFELLKTLGIPCAHAEIITRDQASIPEQVPFEHILAVTRFDRNTSGQRVHMEEFAQIFQYTPKQKYGKGFQTDLVAMIRLLNYLSASPVTDVQDCVNRIVAFTLLGNTDAHLKNWALLYPDKVTPRLAPVYDPVSVSSFFEGMGPMDYAVNRKIDEIMSQLSWDDLHGLLKEAGIRRASHFVSRAKSLVAQAKEQWPLILRQAPLSMEREVLRRLNGGVQLANS